MVLDYCEKAAEALGIDGSGCETDHAIVDTYLVNVSLGSRI